MFLLYRFLFLTFAVWMIQVGADDIDPSSTDQNDILEPNKTVIVEKNLNEVFDRMLPKIREDIIKNGLDPLSLPDEYLRTTKIPGLRGKIHLQKGWAQEASTIKRTGDVIVQYGGKKLNFDFALGFDTLDITYAYTLKYLLYKRKGDFHGQFHNVKLKVYGFIDFTTYQVTLKYFDLVHVGKFSLKLEGHLADHLLNVLTKLFTTFSRDSVLKNIEERFEETLQAKIKEFNDSVLEPILPSFLNATKFYN
ncbi:uncharacterized protein LOC122860764 isoform X1 [Aphidius gifuensis]|uniref:uncharacterized protein LOC122860764 isoform X1 n=2 Tax=Aphidius gifuensis TaxID=684658 RepID=UPI001CDC5237|nr:uncharacterized protein LOC122860764 isoform X1 [Aphidius gifuensis]